MMKLEKDMSLSDLARDFSTRLYFPKDANWEELSEFLSGQIFQRAQGLHAQGMKEDRFGYKSRISGIFGDASAKDRKAIDEYLCSQEERGARVMIHAGIGGQALGSRAQIESVGVREGYRVYVLEKIGIDFAKLYSEIEGKGFKASEILIHASSKSGTTDETMINFQNALRALIRGLAQGRGLSSNVAQDLISKYEGKGDLAKINLVSLGLSLDQKKLLQEAFDHVVFTTTPDSKQSRIYELAQSPFVKELSQEVDGQTQGLLTFPIPNNVGGRFSRRSQSGELSAGFAGRDIFKIYEGALKILPLFETSDIQVNPALKLALLIYLSKVDFICASVQSSNQMAVADAFRQLFPESNGKDGQGPFVVSSVGQKELNDRMHSLLNTFYILINVQGDQGKNLELVRPVDSKRFCFEYRQKNLSEEEEAMRDLFFDEMTVWFGLLSAAEIATDIHSKEYEKRDPQNQPFVEHGKKLMRVSAKNLDRASGAARRRCEEESRKVKSGPIIDSIHLFENKRKLNAEEGEGRIQKILSKMIFPSGISQNDQELEHLLKKVSALRVKRRLTRAMGEVAQLDQEIENFYTRFSDFGRASLPDPSERQARILAALICEEHQKGKMVLPVFYTALEQAEILGEWWRFVGGRYLHDFGLGTREQHSHFQSLLDGKEVVLPLLIDFVTPYEEMGRREEKIESYGLAKDYLKGLYPDEVRRLYLEAEAKTFVKITKRSCMVLRMKDLGSKEAELEAWRFFTRVWGILHATG
ncbi:MAG: hypothetical protein HYS08_07065 [Chlamydiae bacterium]|nr:hypothetical protein [Chlamydiota bacterium]MBI3266422.1 hypothetical protein [Chlamydiota bacterium]